MNDGFDGTALERAQERESRRIDPELAAKPVEVRSLADIQRVIAEFAPGAQKDGAPVEVSTIMSGEAEDGHTETYRVSAMTSIKSRRSILLEGLEVIKRYQEVVRVSHERVIPIEVNGVEMSPPPLQMQDPKSSIDPLIKRWFGGRRLGLKISWDIGDGYLYLYDVYTNKLTRALKED